ncbi:MAG: response regulator [Oscillochloris sp.]|nr:response regulator [Oscillochloris sp.]
MASILIIDDDQTLLSNLGDRLVERGYTVQTSSETTQAQQLFAEQRPDLVILEVRMNGDTGWNLLPQLAAERPVLVLSGAGREEDVIRGFESGAIDYVAKPYRSEELVARIRVRLETVAVPALSPPPQPDTPAAPRVTTTTRLQPANRRNRRDNESDESVFMSEAEEMALLRTPTPAPVNRAAPSVDAEPSSLGRYLHTERMRRQLTLVQIENDLKIRMSYLQAIEDEKFTLLPRGPVAIQMVRQYADYLHLDGNELADRFRRDHYVEPTEPPPALGGRRMPRSLPRWVITLLAVMLALAVTFGVIIALDPNFFQQVPAYLSQLWEQILNLFP